MKIALKIILMCLITAFNIYTYSTGLIIGSDAVIMAFCSGIIFEKLMI